MKKTIKLTESNIKNMIREAVKNALTEGSSNDEVYSKWDEIKNMIGADAMLDSIFNYLSGDEILRLLDYFEADGVFETYDEGL